MPRLALASLLVAIGCGSEPSRGSSSDGGAGGDGGGGAGGGGGSELPLSDVAQVQVPASFAPAPGGGYTIETGLEIFDVTRAFYAEHPDVYDFVVVYTDFLVHDVWQFGLTTRVDIGGIGQDIVYPEYYGWPLDWTAEAGSAGALQHVVLMNDRSLWAQSAFTAQDILVHEVGHRWGAATVLPGANDPLVLLDSALSHWPVIVGPGGPSALGYGELVDHGDGTFTHEAVKPLAYAPLELYLMGLVARDDALLGDLFFVPDAGGISGGATIDSVNGNGTVTFSGQRTDLDVADLEAALGPRLPAHPEAQTSFRFAFVLVCDGSCSAAGLAFVEDERTSWERTFATATGGRASATTSL
jgi:hypothetical protein